MVDKYFVVHGSEDGESSISEMSKDEVLGLLAGDEGENNGMVAVDELPDDLQNFDGDKIVIIKGQIVVPKPKKVVTEFEL